MRYALCALCLFPFAFLLYPGGGYLKVGKTRHILKGIG